MSPKIAIPVVLGFAGASVATATTLITTSFSSLEKCWYDDEKVGDFLEKVEEAVKKKFDDEKTLDLKNFIKSLCKLDTESPLDKFDEKFSGEDYNDVFDLLKAKWSSINQSKNKEKRLD